MYAAHARSRMNRLKCRGVSRNSGKEHDCPHHRGVVSSSWREGSEYLYSDLGHKWHSDSASVAELVEI